MMKTDKGLYINLHEAALVNYSCMSLDLDSYTNIKTVTYGAQIGATMNIVNNVDFDLGYRYNLSASESIDHTSGITAGIHYKY